MILPQSSSVFETVCNGFPFSENTPATGKGERASEYPSIAARISSPNLDPHQQ